MIAGVARYADEVRRHVFPAPEHFYSIDDDELRSFREDLAARNSRFPR
jgi:3-methyl-2-oxobutanoate hydroxymethyltransferase